MKFRQTTDKTEKVKYVISSRKLGKYAGHCTECGLMRGTEDSQTCGRCGHTHTTTAKAVNITSDK